jgi:uncharacterized membrane protein YbhN (UPF0104 family)
LSVVLLYRLLSFWAVVVIGGGCWLTIRRWRTNRQDPEAY